jgi:hypothetical protein
VSHTFKQGTIEGLRTLLQLHSSTEDPGAGYAMFALGKIQLC